MLISETGTKNLSQISNSKITITVWRKGRSQNKHDFITKNHPTMFTFS